MRSHRGSRDTASPPPTDRYEDWSSSAEPTPSPRPPRGGASGLRVPWCPSQRGCDLSWEHGCLLHPTPGARQLRVLSPECVRETEPAGHGHNGLLQESVHVVPEAEMSQDPMSARGGPRRADGVTPGWGRSPASWLIHQETQQMLPPPFCPVWASAAGIPGTVSCFPPSSVRRSPPPETPHRHTPNHPEPDIRRPCDPRK